MRPRMPRNATLATMTAVSVMSAVSGASIEVRPGGRCEVEADERDDGARDHGGMSASIQREPSHCTMSPTSASSTPTTTMPKSAAPIGSPTSAPIAARIGAMNANEEPR